MPTKSMGSMLTRDVLLIFPHSCDSDAQAIRWIGVVSGSEHAGKTKPRPGLIPPWSRNRHLSDCTISSATKLIGNQVPCTRSYEVFVG